MADNPYAEFEKEKPVEAPMSKDAPVSKTSASSGAETPYAEFERPVEAQQGEKQGEKEPGMLDVANRFYASNPNDPLLTRVGKGFGRVALTLPNMVESIVAPPQTEEEKLQASVPMGRVTVAAKRLLVDPSVAAYKHVDEMARAQEERFKQAGKPVPTSGKIAEGLGKAMSVVPVVGPAALQWGEQAGKGDVAGTMAEVGTFGVLPELVKEVSPGGVLPGAPPEGATAFPTVNLGLDQFSDRPTGRRIAAGVEKALVPRNIAGGAGAVAGGIGGLSAGSSLGPVVESITGTGGVGLGAKWGAKAADFVLGEDRAAEPLVRLPQRIFDDHARALVGLEDIAKKADSAYQAASKKISPYLDSGQLSDAPKEIREEVEQTLEAKKQAESTLSAAKEQFQLGREALRNARAGNPMEGEGMPAILKTSGRAQTPFEEEPIVREVKPPSLPPPLGRVETPTTEAKPSEPQAVSTAQQVKQIGKLVEKGTGGIPLKPDVPLRDQLQLGRLKKLEAGERLDETRKSQFSRVNGEELNKAIPDTAEGDFLRDKLHSVGNTDLRQLAINFGLDMQDKNIGRGKFGGVVPRHQIFDDLLAKGVTPEELSRAVDQGLHLKTRDASSNVSPKEAPRAAEPAEIVTAPPQKASWINQVLGKQPVAPTHNYSALTTKLAKAASVTTETLNLMHELGMTDAEVQARILRAKNPITPEDLKRGQ